MKMVRSHSFRDKNETRKHYHAQEFVGNRPIRGRRSRRWPPSTTPKEGSAAAEGLCGRAVGLSSYR